MPPQFGQPKAALGRSKAAVGRSLGVAPEQGRSGLSLKALAYPRKRAAQARETAQAATGALGAQPVLPGLQQAREVLQRRMATQWGDQPIMAPGVPPQAPAGWRPEPIMAPGVPPQAVPAGVLPDLAAPIDLPNFATRYRSQAPRRAAAKVRRKRRRK